MDEGLKIPEEGVDFEGFLEVLGMHNPECVNPPSSRSKPLG